MTTTNKTIAITSCVLAMLFCSIDYFIQVGPSVIVDNLMKEFSITAIGIGLLGSVFYYAYLIMQIPAGLLVDHFGAKRILFFAIIITAIGIMIFATTHHFTLALFGRFLTGFGSAFAFLCALHFAATWFDTRYFALIAGFVQLTVAIGSMIGGAPLAYMSEALGWREAFWIIGILTFVLALAILFFARDGTRHVDDQLIPKQHWLHSLKLTLKNQQVWWIASCSLVSWFPVVTVGALWGVPYLTAVYHLSSAGSAELLLALWLGIGLGSPAVGALAAYVKSKKMLTFGCFALGLIGACLLLLAPYLPFYMMLFALFLLGIAAAIQAFSFSLVKDVVPHTLFGAAAGIVNLGAIFGGALGQLLAGVILGLLWTGTVINDVPVYAVADYQVALISVPIVLLVGVFIARFKLRG